MNPAFPTGFEWAIPLAIIIGAASMVLKGFALYRAGSTKDKAWFVALFIINTAGILELLYLFVFSKRKK